MGLHRFFHGDRTECAKYYPFAKRKLDEMRAFMGRAGIHSFSRKYDNSLGDVVRVRIDGDEETIEIRAGGDGYYCLGDLGGSTSYISASDTALGAFANRGETGANTFVIPNLFYVGRGIGAAPDTDFSEGITTVYESRDALVFTEVLRFSFASDRPVAWRIAPSGLAVLQNSVEQAYNFGTVFHDGEYRAAVLYTLDGAGTWDQQVTSYGNGIEVYAPSTQRLGPRTLWAYVPVPLNDANSDRHLSYVMYTEDNWASASTISAGGLETDLLDSPSEGEFNDGISTLASSIESVRLNTGEVIYACVSPVLRETTRDVKVYKAGAPNGEPQWTHNLSQGYENSGVHALLSQGVPVLEVLPDPAENAVFYIGNEDATSWTARATSWLSKYVGIAGAIDRDTIVVTIYNPDTGHYELHQTKDLGQTWTFRATVRTDAPASDDLTGLERFGVLSILRQNKRPANSFPGQPWIGDNRITPPWEA